MDQANLSALKAAVKLLADAAVDTEAVVASGGGLFALFAYKNLLPDLVALAPQIGEIPAEAKAMAPEDYVALVGDLVAGLSLTDAHAGTVVDSALGLLKELVDVVLPRVEALAAAIKKPAAPAA